MTIKGGLLVRTEPASLEAHEVPMDCDRGRGWQLIRDTGPVVRIGDTTMLTRREDVLAALRRPSLFSSRKAFDQLGCPLPLIPISLDPPDHTRYRKLLQPYFSPHALSDMTPALRTQAADLVGELAPRGRCDAVADLALPYPSQVFLTMFGFPLADRDRLIDWKDTVLLLASEPHPDPADLAAALELFGYLTNAVADRRANPGDDLLSKLVTAEEPLSDQDAIGLSFLFVMAGLDTVTSSLGSAMWKLATRPDLRRRLQANPELIGDFIEQLLRLEGPVPAVPRVTTEDVTIGNVRIAANTLVWLCIGAANREELHQGEPQDVQLRTGGPVHWAFGSGAHRCLGSHLARLELRLVLTAWLARVPEFELTPGSDPRIHYPATTFAFDSVPLLYPTD